MEQVQQTRSRSRKSNRVEQLNPAAKLIEALRFISVAQKAKGNRRETYCRISGGGVYADNGIVGAGHQVDVDLEANPNTMLLLAALEKCVESFTLTQLSTTELAVTSGEMRVVVPCIESTSPVYFDQNIAVINDEIKYAFLTCCSIVNSTMKTISTRKSSVMLQAQTCVSTNNNALVEVWHGIDLPPDLLIHKASALAVAKCKKELTGFGFSEDTVTFWYGETSFISVNRTHTEDLKPPYQHYFEMPRNPLPIPDGFFSALKQILPFLENDFVYFTNLGMHSKPDFGGSSVALQGLPTGLAFNAKMLLAMPFITHLDFDVEAGIMHFTGQNLRGVVSALDVTDTVTLPEADDTTDDSSTEESE